MKIEYLNTETIEPAMRYHDPIVSMSGKSGYIQFSKSAAKKLRLTAAYKAEFVKIENNGVVDHYLMLNGKNGFPLQINVEGRFIIRNVNLARKVLTAYGFELKDSARFLVAGSIEVEGDLLHVLICKTKKK